MVINLKHLFLLILYTLILSSLVFIGKHIFFPSQTLEETYVEPSLWNDFVEFDDVQDQYVFLPKETPEWESAPEKAEVPEKYREIHSEFYEKFLEGKRADIHFHYVPATFSKVIEHTYTPLAEMFFYQDDILKSIHTLSVYYYENKGDVRGRMKKKNIHMFGVEYMPEGEFLSVLIHEFGHYFDIYSFPRTSFGDESDEFYKLSWDAPTIIKPTSTQADFVSGYAMTNQYEDFAESYTYYILHNKDFLQKAEGSDVLAKKYGFFRDSVFRKNQFYKENFSKEPVKNYYWDITKIEVDIKKFLQYVQNSL